MKAYRYWMIAGLALATVATVPAFGQYRVWDDHRGGWYQDRDHDRDDDDRDRDRDRDHERIERRQAYRRGFDDAMRDRQRNRGYRANPWHYRDNDDRRAYQQGYYDGYNRGVNNGNWGYNNGPWNNGNGGWGYNRGGYQAGYQTGMDYGRHDRSVGKPFRPTDSQAYHDADRGYNSSYGDKGLFRSQFRQGYEQGYQRGYYGR